MITSIKYYLTVIYYAISNFIIYDCLPVYSHLNLPEVKHMIVYGKWEWGAKWYKDKPLIGMYYLYYDGNNFAIHLGNFWVSVNY